MIPCGRQAPDASCLKARRGAIGIGWDLQRAEKTKPAASFFSSLRLFVYVVADTRVKRPPNEQRWGRRQPVTYAARLPRHCKACEMHCQRGNETPPC